MAFSASENFDSYTGGADFAGVTGGGSGFSDTSWTDTAATPLTASTAQAFNGSNSAARTAPLGEPNYRRTMTNALSGTSNVMHFVVRTSGMDGSGGRNFAVGMASSDLAGYCQGFLDISNNRIAFISNGGGGNIVLISGISADTWYHVWLDFNITAETVRGFASTTITTPTWVTGGTLLTGKTWNKLYIGGQFGVTGTYTAFVDDIRDGFDDMNQIGGSYNDSVNITEGVTVTFQPDINVSDSLNITENANAARGDDVSVSDGLDITENVTITNTDCNVSTFELIPINDDFIPYPFSIDVNDSVNISENTSGKTKLFGLAFDAATDFSGAALPGGGNHTFGGNHRVAIIGTYGTTGYATSVTVGGVAATRIEDYYIAQAENTVTLYASSWISYDPGPGEQAVVLNGASGSVYGVIASYEDAAQSWQTDNNDNQAGDSPLGVYIDSKMGRTIGVGLFVQTTNQYVGHGTASVGGDGIARVISADSRRGIFDNPTVYDAPTTIQCGVVSATGLGRYFGADGLSLREYSELSVTIYESITATDVPTNIYRRPANLTFGTITSNTTMGSSSHAFNHTAPYMERGAIIVVVDYTTTSKPAIPPPPAFYVTSVTFGAQTFTKIIDTDFFQYYLEYPYSSDWCTQAAYYLVNPVAGTGTLTVNFITGADARIHAINVDGVWTPSLLEGTAFKTWFSNAPAAFGSGSLTQPGSVGIAFIQAESGWDSDGAIQTVGTSLWSEGSLGVNRISRAMGGYNTDSPNVTFTTTNFFSPTKQWAGTWFGIRNWPPDVNVSVNDAVNITENTAITNDTDLTVSDSVNITESITTAQQSSINVFDDGIISEDIEAYTIDGNAIILRDGIGISEQVNAGVSDPSPSIYEEISITEDIETWQSFTWGDFVDITENVVVDTLRISSVQEQPVGTVLKSSQPGGNDGEDY